MTTDSHRIAILGLGGGGAKIAARLASGENASALSVAVADTDVSGLERCPADAARIELGEEWTRHEGSGGDIVLGERAASASVAPLREFIAGARLLIVAAGLGGGTGSGAAKVVARLVRESETTALFLVTLPFAFEGSWRRDEADKCLDRLRQLAETVIVVPNDLLFTVLPADTPATEAFALADGLLAEAVAGFARIVSAQGLVTADFASLKALLRHRQATCRLGVGRGAGDTRWQDAIQAFLECPLIGGRDALAEADAAVLTLLGGTDLSVGEIQTCLSAFQQYFAKEARLVVGAYADERCQGTLQITGLVCRYHDAGPEPAAAPELVPASEPARAPRKKRRRPVKPREVQGELPLQEQALGIFSGSPPTTVGGQNLDIPTFQRRGIHLDAGDHGAGDRHAATWSSDSGE